MTAPKVVVFAPGDQNSYQRFEEAGCEITLGKASWADPTGNTTEEIAAMAVDADALVGTSIKGGRIDRSVMLASEQLRIVAKYTPSASMRSIPTSPPSSASSSPTRRPRRTGAASSRRRCSRCSRS